MSTFVHRHRWKLLAVTSALADRRRGCDVILVYIPRLPELIVQGDKRDLRAGPEPVAPPGAPGMLVLALDGVDRELLYDLFRAARYRTRRRCSEASPAARARAPR